jgi:hypothetical protein
MKFKHFLQSLLTQSKAERFATGFKNLPASEGPVSVFENSNDVVPNT